MDNMQEELERFVNSRFGAIKDTVINYYPVETFNFAIDEMSENQIPAFLDVSNGNKIYGITYVSGDIASKKIVAGVMMVEFEDLETNLTLGRAYLEDNVVIAEKEAGESEWTWL